MFRKTFAEINLDHLESNLNVFRSGFAASPLICPMVKANAYGHGDVQVSKCLEILGIQTVGVCLIEEGILLRRFGFQNEILVFRGFDRPGALEMVHERMTPVVSSWKQLEILEEVAIDPISVHLKFDTGMNRLGFSVTEADQLLQKFWQNKKFRLKAVLTHLYEGELALEPHSSSQKQLLDLLGAFKKFESLGVYAHALNSAGALARMRLLETSESLAQHPLMKVSWGIRPGLALYGYNPLQGADEFGLKPVMTLKSFVSVLRKIKEGETVSYGGTFKALKDSVIGVVPIGYADGYHRLLSNKAEVLFCGRKVPVVGNICMDYLMIDVTQIAAERGIDSLYEQEVILFGSEGPSAAELAKLAQSISWEMLTSVGERVPRVFVGHKSDEVIRSLKS